MTANGYAITFWGDEDVLELDNSWWLQQLVNILKTTDCFKRVNFEICILS